MSDTVGKQRIRTDANTDVKVQLVDSAGTNLADITATGELQVDVAAQSLGALKISRDGAAPSASKGSYVEVTTADAILAANNPLSARISNGTNYNSATAPLFTKLTDGTNANSATAPAFVELTDGTAAIGVSGNPLYVTSTAAGGTTVFRYNNATVTSGATTNIDYTVTAGKTLTINSIIVSGPESGNYQMIIDPAGANTSKIKLYTSPGSNTASYVFQRALTVAASTVVRIAKTNDSAQTAEMGFTWEGSEV